MLHKAAYYNTLMGNTAIIAANPHYLLTWGKSAAVPTFTIALGPPSMGISMEGSVLNHQLEGDFIIGVTFEGYSKTPQNAATAPPGFKLE